VLLKSLKSLPHSALFPSINTFDLARPSCAFLCWHARPFLKVTFSRCALSLYQHAQPCLSITWISVLACRARSQGSFPPSFLYTHTHTHTDTTHNTHNTQHTHTSTHTHTTHNTQHTQTHTHNSHTQFCPFSPSCTQGSFLKVTPSLCPLPLINMSTLDTDWYEGITGKLKW